MTYILFSIACQNSGSVVLDKTQTINSSIDDTGNNTDDTSTTEDSGSTSNVPEQLNYAHWFGTRTIIFPEMCTFDIQEVGSRLTDPTDPVVAITLASCPKCQVYKITNQPESVECGELGTLPTGGERYRALSFMEQYSDGTLNVNNGPVEIWHILEPNWTFDFISVAEHVPDEDTGGQNRWVYTAENNFQAFTYSESSTVTLSE